MDTIDVGQNGTPQQTGMVLREGFAGNELQLAGDISARAAAEQARAQVEARYVMAIRRPRDIDVFRQKLLKECRRPGFAGVALYAKPIGDNKITGFSIRFAEAALRLFTNVYAPIETIFEDDRKRIVRITVTDLECNVTYPKDITINKTVERRNGRGRKVIDKRTNSFGDQVYIVEATEDELATKEAAAASKAMRQSGLRLIPGDVLDEAKELVQKTLHDENAKDPDAAKKKVLDAYAYYNLGPDQLAEYLGHAFAQASPGELRDLIAVYNTLRDGETTWADVLEQRRLERNVPPPADGQHPAAPTATARLAQKVRAQQPAPPEPAPAPSEPISEAPAVSGPPLSSDPPAPTGEADAAMTQDQFAQLKAELTAKQAELVQLIGKDRAQAAWTGSNGVKTLRGVRTRGHMDERLNQAKTLVELAKVEAEIVAAKREILAKVKDGEKLIRERSPDSVKNLFAFPPTRVHEVLDELLTILEEHGPKEAGEAELPWGDDKTAEPSREPGED